MGGLFSIFILGIGIFCFGLYLGSPDDYPGDLLLWIRQPSVIVTLLILSVLFFVFKGTRRKLLTKFENSKLVKRFEAL